MSASSQFSLLRERRFAPLFWVQFLGAANDNIFKFAFTLLATYSASRWGGVEPRIAGFLIGGLFIAPFMLFSATSGQLADKLEKSWFIRRVKDAEIGVILIGGTGLALHLPLLVYAAVFLLGLQATVFGPVKYSYLPQHLDAHEVTGGNGMVEMGTFVAILLGTIGGGLLISQFGDRGAIAAALASLLCALLGRLAAQFVPHTPSADPRLRINWNPLSETWRNLKIAHGNPAVFNSIIGISWLWFFGSVFLTSFTPFARENLGGTEAVVTFLLALFSVGIGIGSLACERLSRRRVEIGLVPLGSIGMTLFAVDLYLAATAFRPMQEGSLQVFLGSPGAWRIVVDLMLLALFGGLYSVPLYALIQTRADRTHVARIVAANNILNAVFMVVASLMAAALLRSGLTIPQLFLVTGLMNAAVALYIYHLVPEFLLRFLAWVLTHTLYRLRSLGTDRIPVEGPAVLACNHVSFVDAIVIMGESPRPIRFVMDHRIFRIPLMNWFFRNARAIAIAPAREDPKMFEGANERIDAALADGDLVCIFPEGKITYDGELSPFKQGVQRIVERTPVPVIPMALRGLWGSVFSRFGGAAFSRPVEARLRRGFRSKLELIVGEPVPAGDVTPDLLMARVAELRGDER
ncbi:MAG TPA: MFS transporter [Burkholderiaceae bacterium]|nr:MFS transporter [Burkholderiaceae bacterium]